MSSRIVRLYRAALVSGNEILWHLGHDRKCIALSITLMALDIQFLILHVAESTALRHLMNGGTAIPSLRLDADKSLSEWWGYTKAFSCSILLAWSFIENRQKVIAAMALLFFMIGMDDSLSIHEYLGLQLSGLVIIDVGQSTGELIAWALMGLLIGPTVFWSALHSNTTAAGFALVLCIVILVLVTFGVGIDAVHSIAERFQHPISGILTIVEDWGELVTLSIAVLAVFSWRKITMERRDAPVEQSR